jgi:hypothetical protein
MVAGLAAIARLLLLRWVPLDLSTRPRRTLTAAARFGRAHRQDAVLFYALLAVFSVWLLLGPPFGLWQFVYFIPPLSFIRAPLRFSLLTVLALSVLAGCAFDRYARAAVWLGPRRRVLLCGLVAALFVVEWAAIPLDGIETTVDIRPIDRWLDTQPKPFTIAEVPLADPGDTSRFNAESARYMVHSTAHFQKTVNGFTGVLPDEYATLYGEMARFPAEDGLRHLVALGVNYVVVHGDDYSAEDFARLESRLPAAAPWLTLVYAEGRERVYSLHAVHAPGGPGRP